MKKYIPLIFLLLFSTNIYSQHKKTFYIGEDYKPISFKKFTKKKAQPIYNVIIAENDTAIFKKIRFLRYFSKLNPLKKKQFFKLMHKRFKVDSLKPLLIHHIDSVPNAAKMPKESKIEILDENNKPTGKFYPNTYTFDKHENHRHLLSKNDYLKGFKKHYDTIDNNKFEYVHLYERNNGFPKKELEKLKTYHDPRNFVRKIFSDGMGVYHIIIVHPDGEFYVSNIKYSSKENLLLKRKVFDRTKKKWLRYLKKSNR